jgi:preprotein translocase subunit SecE
MKITEYIKETRAEMAHVTWPSRKQAIAYAVAVVLVSFGVAAFLGLFDFIFARLLTLFV